MRTVALSATAAFVLVTCVHAQVSTRRIEEASFVAIGGIEQWVTIRGNDDRNPVLLLLHGGRGDVQSPFISTYAPYEDDFVLVQWDERGAGRTFSKNGAAGVTLERQISDGIDLAEQLRRRSYYVIQGRHDLFAPTALAEAYFAKVSAPDKRMIVIEDAGHFVLATHQAEAVAALKQMLR